MSPRARSHALAAVALTAAATALAPPTAGAVTAHAIPGLVSDLRAADGSVRIATAYPSRAYDARIVNLTLAGGGKPLSTPLLRTSGDRGWVTPALTADGAVVAYAWQRSSRTKPVVQVITSDGVGGQSAPQTLSRPGATARPLDPIEVGPTGAVALRFLRGGPNQAVQWLAFRPATATAFGAAVPLGSARESRLTDFHLTLGPDGGGILVGVPSKALRTEPWARRIFPGGQLGPKLQTGFGAHDLTRVAAAYGPSGTLVLAAASLDGIDDEDPTSAVGVVSLSPAANAFTPVQRFDGKEFSAPDRDNLSVAVGTADRTVVAAGAGTDGLDVYEGPPTALARTATIDATFPFDARVFLGADGALAAVWSDVKATGDRLAGPPVIRTTRRGPGAVAFVPPHIALKVKAEQASLRSALLLRDGRLAIVVDPIDSSGIEGNGLSEQPSLAAIVRP